MRQIPRYNGKELYKLIKGMGPLFAHVRLIKREDGSGCELDEEGNLHTRCEEPVHTKSCFLISVPIQLEGCDESLAIEMYARISDAGIQKTNNSHSLVMQLSDVYEKVYQDALTNAFNRRFLSEMNFLYKDVLVPHKELSVVSLDVYRFKDINDNYGHLAGDEVLKAIVETIEKDIRERDSVIRMGGDEFMVILMGCDENHAEVKGAQIAADIADLSLECIQGKKIVVDYGCAHTQEFDMTEESMKKMMEEADQKMYRMKNGRE